MPATKAYTRVNFENYPSTNTPLNATNLNKVDKGIDDIDDLLVTARNNIETLQSNATTDEANILALQGSVAALNGFTFYPAGEVNLVALVVDDSFYKDANDKYVLADSATGQALIDGVTYKALASTEDTRGEVGADSVCPFSKIEMIAFFHESLMDGLVHNVTLKAESTYAVICYPYSRRDSSYPAGTSPTISGNYTLEDQSNFTTNGWFYLYCKVQIIKKNKGDANVTITFPQSTEKYGGFGFVVEF